MLTVYFLLIMGSLVYFFSKSTLWLGVLLFVVGFSIFSSILFYVSLWYGLMFFLIYMGGLLVLFFYMLSLSSNPVMKKNVSLPIFGAVLMFVLFYIQSGFTPIGQKKNSEYLYSNFEFLSTFIILLILLYVLWVVGKLVYSVSGSVRPFV